MLDEFDRGKDSNNKDGENFKNIAKRTIPKANTSYKTHRTKPKKGTKPDFIIEISASLNSVLHTDCKMMYDHDVATRVEQSLRHNLSNHVHVIHATVAPNSEPLNGANHIAMRTQDNGSLLVTVKSLELGNVALVRTPNCRRGSHPTAFSPGGWLSNLKNLPFEYINAHSRAIHQLNWSYGDDVVVGTILKRESRYRVFKMPDVNNKAVQSYLDHTFTACLQSVHAGEAAELIIGVCDVNCGVIGINGSRQKITKDVIELECKNFFSQVFPPITSSQVSATIHEVKGSVPSDWNGSFYSMLSKNRATVALRLFGGFCYAYLSVEEGDAMVKLYVEPKTYVYVNNLIELCLNNGILNLPASAHEQACYRYVTCMLLEGGKDDSIHFCSGEFKDLSWIYNWKEMSADEFNTLTCGNKFYRRIFVHLKVTFPEACCYCSCTDASIAGHGDNGANIFAYFKDANGEVGIMSPFQIWLRNKESRNGSLLSPLFFPLRFEHNIKLLVVVRDEFEICKASLEHYFENHIVSFNFIIFSKEDLKEKLSVIACDSHLEAIVVTTWKSGTLAKYIAEVLTRNNFTIRSLMFTSLDNANISVLPEWKYLNVEDMCLLKPIVQGGSTMAVGECKESNEGQNHQDNIPSTAYFDIVPCRFSDICDSKLRDLANKWILESQDIAIEIVDKYVIQTAVTNFIEQDLRMKPNVNYVKIHQKVRGSGATSILYRIGWDLRNEAIVCIRNNMKIGSNPLNWNDFGDQIKETNKSWLVFLVDTGRIESALETFFNSIPSHFSKVSIVEIVRGGLESNCKYIVNPFLPKDDFAGIISKVKELFPSNCDAISKLKRYVEQYPNDAIYRHIWVVMHIATTDRFFAPKIFLRDKWQSMGADTQERVILLAFLAGYSTSYGSLPIDAVGTFTNEDKEMLTYIHGTHVAFMHPCLAQTLLEIAYECNNNINGSDSLYNAWMTLMDRIKHINLSFSTLKAIIRSLLFDKADGKFSLFASELLKLAKENVDDYLKLPYFSMEKLAGWVDEFYLLLLKSRMCRFVNLVDQSIEYAELALKISNAQNSYIAENNLATVYAAKASCCSDNAETTKYLNQARDIFNKLSSVSEQSSEQQNRVLTQLFKWEDRITNKQLQYNDDFNACAKDSCSNSEE